MTWTIQSCETKSMPIKLLLLFASIFIRLSHEIKQTRSTILGNSSHTFGKIIPLLGSLVDPPKAVCRWRVKNG